MWEGVEFERRSMMQAKRKGPGEKKSDGTEQETMVHNYFPKWNGKQLKAFKLRTRIVIS